MLEFPVYFAVWIGTGTVGLVSGCLAVHRAKRRSRRLLATAEVQTAIVEAELVSAA